MTSTSPATNRSHVLVYGEHRERLNPDTDGGGDTAAAGAIHPVEDRTAWPPTDDPDWEGPDPLVWAARQDTRRKETR